MMVFTLKSGSLCFGCHATSGDFEDARTYAGWKPTEKIQLQRCVMIPILYSNTPRYLPELLLRHSIATISKQLFISNIVCHMKYLKPSTGGEFCCSFTNLYSQQCCWMPVERYGSSMNNMNRWLWILSVQEHCLMGIKGTVRRSTDGHIIHANVDTDIMISEEPEYGMSELCWNSHLFIFRKYLWVAPL